MLTDSIKNILNCIILASILISILTSSVARANDTSLWGENLPYRQKINIPIDTSNENAKFQPIDIKIEFDNPCWAKNEQEHSIRICYYNGRDIVEIESQIYDLEHSDRSHIKSCGLVFLIPEKADGNEEYYVFYDNSETTNPNYTDHVRVEDSHYYNEPASGMKADFGYFKITEDGYITYGICYEGSLFGNGYGVSQVVIKLKSRSTDFEMINVDQLASFTMLHSIDGEKEFTGTSWAENAKREILIDGNLMVKVRVTSISPENAIKTDNIYTYYYCPTETKRISANVDHEVLKTSEIAGSHILDLTYANIMTFEIKCKTLKNINTGKILPLLHVYAEDDTIKSFPVPLDPVSRIEEMVLDKEDDIDLGIKPWLCMNDPSTGKTHGLIFQSNHNIIEGEEDGLQVKSFSQQSLKLPGIEIETASAYATRNDYEKGGNKNTIIPKGFNAKFNAEFITFENCGFESVDKECEIYQKLVTSRESNCKKTLEETETNIQKYQLKTYVHNAPSFPFGALLSASLGKNFSYIYAEIYDDDNNLISSGSVDRLSLSDKIDHLLRVLEVEQPNLLQKIKILFQFFDWKNLTLFKKISFPDLKPDMYIVKIFHENLLSGKPREYIGFATVDLNRDDAVHIYCNFEGTIDLSVLDQNEKGVENVRFLLEQEDVIIADATSNEDGSAVLKAPCYPNKPYVLKILYQGFLIEEKTISLGLKNRLIKLKEQFNLENYDLNLKLVDTWSFTPSIDLYPVLTSNQMQSSIFISPGIQENGEYLFKDLYSNGYILNIGYKAFEFKQDISVDKDNFVKVVFPAEYKTNLHILDSYGNDLNHGVVVFSRGGKQVTTNIDKNGDASFLVPPGEYEISVIIDKKLVAQQTTTIKNDKIIVVLTERGSVFHNITTIFGIILAVLSVVFLIFWKRDFDRGVKLLVIALLIVSIISPWWVFSGENGKTSTIAQTFLVPPKIVTLTSSPNLLIGEISSVPGEVTLVLGLLSALMCVSCLLIAFTILFKNRFKKSKMILSISGVLVLLVTIFVFFYTMSLIAEVSVGSFAGSGDMEICFSDIAGCEILFCSWGPGLGFYLAVISSLFLITYFVYKKFVIQK